MRSNSYVLDFLLGLSKIVQRFGNQIDRAAASAMFLLVFIPAFTAALPLVACALGLLMAVPREPPDIDFTNPLYHLEHDLNVAIRTTLKNGFFALSSLAGVLFVAALGLLQRRSRTLSWELKRRHYDFFGTFGLAAAALAIFFGMTIAVFLSPVVLPQAIGTVPLIALFIIALVLLLSQMTFWHEKSGVPFLALLALWTFVVAALNLNDNHAIATVRDESRATSLMARSQIPDSAWDSFQAWYAARPGKDQFENTYPVYVVAAQGGGIYAAYHTAILLSRIQDYCPEFRNHLFAISSVSGGSLGAAVFASVTKALAQSRRANTPDGDSTRSQKLACPAMERAGSPSFAAPSARLHEDDARKILKSNFLAPLAAATLFPDFIQRFIPLPLPAFDRARWLEAAFEASWQQAGIPGRIHLRTVSSGCGLLADKLQLC